GAELLPRDLAYREDRQRGQQRLRDEQRRRRGKDAKERGDERDDRLEMVTEQVEARAPDVDDRRAEVRVLLHVLGVDAQIPRGRVELQQPEQRERGVRTEDDKRDRPGDR